MEPGCGRPPIPPAPASRSRASGGTRTHSLRVTRAVPGRSSIAGVSGWPVGVEPTRRRFTAGSRIRFGFGHSASTWTRTRNPGFVDPCDVRFTTEAVSTPARNRTWTCSLGPSRDGSVSPPRQTVPGVGVEPTPAGSEPAVLPLDDPGMEQPVGVSIPSARREKPVTSPDVERAVCRVAQVGVEPTASLVLSEGGLPVAYRATCVTCRVVKEPRVPGGSRTRLTAVGGRRPTR